MRAPAPTVSTIGPAGVDEHAAHPPQRTMWEHLEPHYPAAVLAAVETYHETQTAWRAARTELESAIADLATVAADDAGKLATAVADSKPTPKPGLPAAEDRARRAVIACQQARERAAAAVWQYGAAMDAASGSLVGPVCDAIIAAADDYDHELARARDALEAARQRLNRYADAATVLAPHVRRRGMSPRRIATRVEPLHWTAADASQTRYAVERLRADLTRPDSPPAAPPAPIPID